MRKLISATLTASVLLLGSCVNRDLCYDHRHTGDVEVILDWSAAPDADPSAMDVYFIPEGGGRPVHYQFAGRDGGTAQVPLGSYRVICVNGDSETNLVERSDSWEDFRVTTLSTTFRSLQSIRGPEPPRVSGTEGERLANSPDRLWSGSATGLYLYDPLARHSVTLTPCVGICRYSVRVTGITNLYAATAVSGSLSSMSGGVHAGPGTLSEELVTVPFDLLSDRVSTVSGVFSSFGHCPAENSPHYLTVYAVMTDGSRYYSTYDVTDQIHGSPDPRSVSIVIDGLELPKPIPSEGGFQPDVSDWEDAGEITVPF